MHIISKWPLNKRTNHNKKIRNKTIFLVIYNKNATDQNIQNVADLEDNV